MTRCSKISITALKCNSQKCLCAKCYHCTVFLHTSRSPTADLTMPKTVASYSR